MRPELDTKNPPGQVAYVDPQHKQLSDYIRSINRREALDSIVSEKKLTFDNWLFNLPEDQWRRWCNDGFASVAAEAWNAALRCGKAPQERSE